MLQWRREASRVKTKACFARVASYHLVHLPAFGKISFLVLTPPNLRVSSGYQRLADIGRGNKQKAHKNLYKNIRRTVSNKKIKNICVFIYFQREGKGGRRRGSETSMWETNIDQFPLAHSLTGDHSHNLGMCPDREWKRFERETDSGLEPGLGQPRRAEESNQRLACSGLIYQPLQALTQPGNPCLGSWMEWEWELPHALRGWQTNSFCCLSIISSQFLCFRLTKPFTIPCMNILLYLFCGFLILFFC